jgi:hypothetical protein
MIFCFTESVSDMKKHPFSGEKRFSPQGKSLFLRTRNDTPEDSGKFAGIYEKRLRKDAA